jgi:hypothetical protein
MLLAHQTNGAAWCWPTLSLKHSLFAVDEVDHVNYYTLQGWSIEADEQPADAASAQMSKLLRAQLLVLIMLCSSSLQEVRLCFIFLPTLREEAPEV